MVHRPWTMAGLLVMAVSPALGAPVAHADGDNNTLIPNNKRLNDGVVANVYTIQQQAGCTNDVKPNPALQHAAQQHAADLMNNRNLNGDIGSNGSTPQQRANAAGYRGTVKETVAINPALAISGVELINRWYYDPADMAIMSNCANSNIGVWSLNSPSRTVVVAVYGHPAGGTPQPALPPGSIANDIPPDPSPDYDASDEIEHGVNWWGWILRGISPAPAHPQH